METTKDYSGVAWRHSNQRLKRCDLKQMLTDDGHPRITTVHFEPLKRVVGWLVGWFCCFTSQVNSYLKRVVSEIVFLL